MHTSALGQAQLPEPTSEQEPPPEPTALTPIPPEQDVIEGEVIILDPPEPNDAHTPPKQKPYWLLVPFTILACLVFVAVSSLLPLLTPSATVLIIPVERSITTTALIQIQGRQLAPLTLSQSETVPATGKRHQDVRNAQGTITFYNGQFVSQTIAAGTIVTGSDGVQVITDQPAVIPAGNPPIYGQVTVAAHAINPGTQGNIPAYDINEACCLASVLAKNTQVFTGGAAARDFIIVTQHDIAAAAEAIKAPLAKSEQAALQAQITTGEALTPPLCSEKVLADHQAGEEATAVHITVSETCEGLAYTVGELRQNAQQMITNEAVKRLGTAYSLIGNRAVSVLHTTITDPTRGTATIAVKIDATYVYRITPGMQQHLIKLIAGKTKEQAIRSLLAVSGIQGIYMTLAGGQNALPQDVRDIHLTILYRGV